MTTGTRLTENTLSSDTEETGRKRRKRLTQDTTRKPKWTTKPETASTSEHRTAKKATSNKTEPQTEIEQLEGQTHHNQATENEHRKKKKICAGDCPHRTGTKSAKYTNKEAIYRHKQTGGAQQD